MATHYLYILPLHSEDWLKLGVSNNPLRRAREFTVRYHDVFDLDRAVLVETEGRRDAATMELSLRRGLSVHRAPMPLTIRTQAGGHTEWLRGAYPALLDACRSSPLPTALHLPARAWFAQAQWNERTALDAWASGLLREYLLDPEQAPDPPLPPALAAQLLDAVHAFHAFGLRVGDHLPPALQAWYRNLPDLPKPQAVEA